MPDFSHRDPTAPEFWNERFEQQFTPWDRGGVPRQLREFVARTPQALTALIPGCGTGHEVAFLSEAGWDVTAIDFSAAAVAAARASLGRWGGRVLQADFFAFTPQRPVDFIYERAFLCALPPRLWPAIAARWARLLAPGGLLAGYFYVDDKPGGPPFAAAAGQPEALLGSCFERIEHMAATDSIPVFAGKEVWQVWRRLPVAPP